MKNNENVWDHVNEILKGHEAATLGTYQSLMASEEGSPASESSKMTTQNHAAKRSVSSRALYDSGHSKTGTTGFKKPLAPKPPLPPKPPMRPLMPLGPLPPKLPIKPKL